MLGCHTCLLSNAILIKLYNGIHRFIKTKKSFVLVHPEKGQNKENLCLDMLLTNNVQYILPNIVMTHGTGIIIIIVRYRDKKYNK